MAPDQEMPSSFEEVTARLDEIVAAVRRKDTSLDESLDLLAEAVLLGGRAVTLVDSAEFSASERAALEQGGEGTGTSADDEGPDAGDAR